MKSQGGDEITLEATDLEKDLGINIDPKLKFSSHIETQVNKANRVMGLIRRSYEYLDGDSFKKLFTALVRPHLEYCNVAWSPRLKKDRNLIESVLRRGTKIIPILHELEYEERLRRLDLPSMSYRRIRGDMIEVYKYTHGIYHTDQILVLDEDTSRRGHNYKLKKQFCNSATRSNFFSFRVVDTWNGLPWAVVNSPSLNAFKARLDRLWSKLKYKIDLDVTCPLPQVSDDITVESKAETSTKD